MHMGYVWPLIATVSHNASMLITEEAFETNRDLSDARMKEFNGSVVVQPRDA